MVQSPIESIKECIRNGASQSDCFELIQKRYKISTNEILDLWNISIKESDAKHAEKYWDDSSKVLSWSHLKVIDEIKVIEGEYGFYYKSKEGIKFSNCIKIINDDIAYKTKDKVLHAKTNMVNDINKDILILEEKLESLKRDRDTVIDKYLEFERVFDM